MELNQVANLIEGAILCDNLSKQEYNFAFASDLMSDVLRWPRENMILITGLSNIQTIRTVEMSCISCVIVARGKQVTEDMLNLAKESNIAIITCPSSMFEISGKLYSNGIKSVY